MGVDKKERVISMSCSVPNMAANNKNSQKRLLIALTLFFASIFASLFITLAGNKNDDYWVLAHPLPSGAIIERSDLAVGSALLAFENRNYLRTSSNALGMVTSRSLRSGELLSRYDVREKNFQNTTAQVAISMQSSEIPTSISEGSEVSIYQIFESRNGEPLQSPKRILVKAFVSAIDREGFKFGGEAVITLTVASNQIETLLAAKSSGRLVMVTSYD